MPQSPRPDTGGDGAGSMQLCVGSLTGNLHLAGASARLQQEIRQRLGEYTGTQQDYFPAPALEMTVTFVSERPRPPANGGTFIRPVVQAGARSISLARWDFEARLERSGPDDDWRGEALCLDSAFTFESLCRVVWSLLLPRWGGALFHGCGLKLPDGGAVLAAGPSGAGKTTLARKAPDARDVLSDEVVVVRRAPEGWRLESTPFFGEFPPVNLAPRHFPLAGVAFLEQRPQLAVATLPPGEAAFRAMSCLMSWQQDDEGVRGLLDLVTAMITEVPVFSCGSRADSSFAEILTGMRPLLRIARAAPS